MPSESNPGARAAHRAPGTAEPAAGHLPVTGVLPAVLSGHYAQIDPTQGVLHVVTLDSGRVVAYRHRCLAAEDIVGTYLVGFGNSVLVLGEGVLAYEVDPALDSVGRVVDLAGARRSLAAHARVDSRSGELHLITCAAPPSQLHVVVSRGGLTRTIRAIDDAPSQIRQIELTRDAIVLLADGFVGVTPRGGPSPKTIWFDVDTDGRALAGAYAHGDTLVVECTGPSLSRWTLDRRDATTQYEVIDQTPHRFATTNKQWCDALPRFMWTVGTQEAFKHDLFTGGSHSHHFGDSSTPSALVFVADPDRSGTEDGGWLVGFVHDDAVAHAELVVLDAQSVEAPALATVLVPRPIPNGGCGIWVSG